MLLRELLFLALSDIRSALRNRRNAEGSAGHQDVGGSADSAEAALVAVFGGDGVVHHEERPTRP